MITPIALFSCAGDPARGGLLGHHDGISSWTINAAADPQGTQQAFVSRHEAAHHRLHSGTPWGLAMLATGLADAEGHVCSDLWLSLGNACTATHEAYATFAAVSQVEAGLEVLSTNLIYLQHLGRANALAAIVTGPGGDVVVDLLMHFLMTPHALLKLNLSELRTSGVVAGLIATDAPDVRFDLLRKRLAQDPELGRTLSHLVLGAPDHVIKLDTVAEVLTEVGISTPASHAVNAWSSSIIDQLRSVHPSLVAEQLGTVDQLTALVDDQQRERVQMHHDPLPLRVVLAEPGGNFPVAEFARTAEGLGVHVWMAWLHSGFLSRQFRVAEDADLLVQGPCLGLLSCDRTHGDPHASWLPWPTVPPGTAAHGISIRGDISPLLFTTLRTLGATPADVDFRGFEPAFILIDSDVLAFLQRCVDRDAQMYWAVIGSSGDRTIDVLAFETAQIPGVVHILVCTAPTGRLVASWIRRLPKTFANDSSWFNKYRDQLWALTRHLLGTLYIFDLHGWGTETQVDSVRHGGIPKPPDRHIAGD